MLLVLLFFWTPDGSDDGAGAPRCAEESVTKLDGAEIPDALLLPLAEPVLGTATTADVAPKAALPVPTLLLAFAGRKSKRDRCCCFRAAAVHLDPASELAAAPSSAAA